jgi:hypothetical protein
MKDGSILDEIKLMINLEPDDDTFDTEVKIHIETAFSLLHHIGGCPSDAPEIEDRTTKWSDFFGDLKNVNLVKSYIYHKVKSSFDPPATSFVIESNKVLLQELEWRINTLEFVFNPAAKEAYSNPAGEPATDWIIDETQPLPAEMKVGEIGIDPVTGAIVRKT